MGIPEGDYVIFAVFDPNVRLGLREALPIQPVIGLPSPIVTKWHISPVDPDSTLYTISVTDQENSKLIVQNSLVFASNIDPPFQFSIEPAGDNRVRFHIPDENNVWRLDGVGAQVRIANADGSPNELFVISVAA